MFQLFQLSLNSKLHIYKYISTPHLVTVQHFPEGHNVLSHGPYIHGQNSSYSLEMKICFSLQNFLELSRCSGVMERADVSWRGKKGGAGVWLSLCSSWWQWINISAWTHVALLGSWHCVTVSTVGWLILHPMSCSLLSKEITRT